LNKPVSILLADDHALVRGTLRSHLEIEPDMTVVADVGDADEALAQAKKLNPNIVLLDIDMPGTLCFEAARRIKIFCPETRILFLSAFSSDRYIEQALAVEASGYITKGEPPEVVVRAIRSVMTGAAYYSPQVQTRFVVDERGVRLAQPTQTRVSSLSQREMEVLRYIARGLSKKQIAALMHISVSTVDAHSARLMNKLDIHDRVELARYAIREGLAEA